MTLMNGPADDSTIATAEALDTAPDALSGPADGPTVDETPDEWAALDATQAALMRGLANITANSAKEVTRARAAAKAGKLDAIGDPVVLIREQRRALELVIDQAQGAPEAPVATLGALTAAYWPHVDERREAAPTGLAGLDKMLGGGLQAGRLVVLLGAPGQGKTTLSNQIAEHVADGGRPVVYVTLEDPAWDLMAKTAARLGNLDYGAVQQGRAAMRQEIDAALALVAARKSAQRLLYIEQAGRLSLAAVQERAAAHFATYDAAHGGGPGLLVIDYLQRAARAALPAGAQTELRLAVGALTDQLRDIGRELDCMVLVPASQNRANYGPNGGAVLASAKESGDIEYGVDVLMAIGEDEKRSATASFIKPWTLTIAKNRQGSTGMLPLDWYPDRQQFTQAGK